VCEENKQVHRNSPVFPHAMVLRLTPRSPRRRVRFATVVRGLRFCLPGWAGFASANLTPATGARTTRLHRTQKRRSSCAPPTAHEVHLALRLPLAPDALASTASHPQRP
jgi:hypothetical protein